MKIMSLDSGMVLDGPLKYDGNLFHVGRQLSSWHGSVYVCVCVGRGGHVMLG